jgi:hypothetical protein
MRATAAGDSSATSFFPGAIEGVSDNELCVAPFHEVQHLAGTPDAGNLHGDGVDRIYACPRLCD